MKPISTWSQFGLMDANSPIMEELIFLHDFINMILVFVLSFVLAIMLSMLNNSFVNKNLLESQLLESIWTVIPAIILIQIALPSLLLLYMLDETANSALTIKTVGHQWFWSYEFSDPWALSNNDITYSYDAYMVPQDSMEDGMFRLLDVDNRTPVPLKTHTRVLITAADVLHSWTVPALGVKADAVPGRLNQVKFLAQRPGLFYGQCSEICGANHSFMPIVVEVIDSKSFLNAIFEAE